MTEIKLRETMWAEMKPYVYGGEECDEIDPMWKSYAEGDMEDDFSSDPLSLECSLFPPGTKVIVSEPVCPNCDTVPYHDGTKWRCIVDCDFDWENWARDKYS